MAKTWEDSFTAFSAQRMRICNDFFENGLCCGTGGKFPTYYERTNPSSNPSMHKSLCYELGPSLSGFLDKLAAFQEKRKIPSITRESNPASMGKQSATLTTTPFRHPENQCVSYKKSRDFQVISDFYSPIHKTL
jgi:hypothetical protein